MERATAELWKNDNLGSKGQNCAAGALSAEAAGRRAQTGEDVAGLEAHVCEGLTGLGWREQPPNPGTKMKKMFQMVVFAKELRCDRELVCPQMDSRMTVPSSGLDALGESCLQALHCGCE